MIAASASALPPRRRRPRQRRLQAALLASAVGLALIARQAPAAGAPVVVRDDRGAVIELARPAQRIVSLLPSLTETVCALGACDRLVGTDRHSNHPPQVAALPKLGGLDDANVERIVALRPDVVLLAGSSRIAPRLAALGLKVVVLEPRNEADVRRAIDQIARLVGSSAAPALWRRIDASIARAVAGVDPAARGLSVYYEVASGPYAASSSSFVGEALQRLGLRNIVPGSLGPYPLLNPEFVVRADPALILIARSEADGLATRPGWPRIRALREQRICRFDPAASDLLARAGPRIGDAALLLARCIDDALAAAPLAADAPSDGRR